MARDAIAFLAAMEFGQADLLGFSIGSFVAQQIALVRPAIGRGLVLASSAPKGASGMHGWAAEAATASRGQPRLGRLAVVAGLRQRSTQLPP
jgi:pimeloyl-ACP methyl ester carboxylesterase